MFGADATVYVNGLIVTTLSISNKDFINSNYEFHQDPNNPLVAVTNAGTINARGYVGLLTSAVKNTGTITVNLGIIVLVSGEAATLDFNEDGLINFVVTEATTGKVMDRESNVLRDLIYNTGLLRVNGWQVQLSVARGVSDVARYVVSQEEARGKCNH